MQLWSTLVHFSNSMSHFDARSHFNSITHYHATSQRLWLTQLCTAAVTAESSLPFRGSNSSIQEYHFHSMELQSFAAACTGRAGFAVRVARCALVPGLLPLRPGRENTQLQLATIRTPSSSQSVK